LAVSRLEFLVAAELDFDPSVIDEVWRVYARTYAELALQRYWTNERVARLLASARAAPQRMSSST
jgi:hypothetical protein